MKSLKILSLLLISISLIFSACGGKKTEEIEEEAQGGVVRVQKLQETEIARNFTFSTTLQAYDRVNIAPTMPGRIAQILTPVGTRVSRGQLLVQMDRTNYDRMKIQHDNLAVDFERMSILNASDNISRQQFDQMKTAFTASQTGLRDLEANTFLRAPFAGVIEARNYENGELFNGAIPILSLVQLNMLKATINIPESFFPQVKKGMPVTIMPDAFSGETFQAEIDIVYPTIDPTTHTFQVQVKIPNADETLRPGMFATASLNLGQTKAVVVPSLAVLKMQGTNDRFVFLNDNGTARRVPVRIGQRFDDQVEIISDEIKEGDEIVVTGQARLNNGVRIQVAD